MIRNGKLLKSDRVRGALAKSDVCCCGCPTDCEDCNDTIELTITGWKECSCRDDTYDLLQDGALCYWYGFDLTSREPAPCCRDLGFSATIDCVDIMGESFWRLAIHSSALLDDGLPDCANPGFQGHTPSLVGYRAVIDSPNCPPAGLWTVTDSSPGCGIPDSVETV